MSELDSSGGRVSALRLQMRQTAYNALIAAALMLLFGYNAWASELRPTAGAPPLYAASVYAYTWTLLGGGAAMLLSAALLLSGVRPALAIDALLTAIVGVLLFGIGAVQVAYEGIGNITAALLILFGVLFLRSAWISWKLHAGAGAAPSQVPAAEPVRQHAPSRSEALERLLNQKRVETHGTPAAIPEIPPEPGTASPARPAEPAASHDPAPEGFLAQLGQENETERK